MSGRVTPALPPTKTTYSVTLMHSAEPTINESDASLYAGAAASGVREPWLRARTALYIIAVWTFVGLFNTEQAYASLAASGRPLAWLQLLRLIAPGMVLWALLTPAIMRLATRYPLSWKTAPLHLLAAGIACVLDASLYHVIDPWVSTSGTRTWVAGFFRYMQINTINYFGVVAVTLVSRYATLLRERMVAAAELKSQLTTAHLQSLQAQLRPHFLFNTLNTIAELVHRDPEAADRMIGRLGALLRRSFDSHGDQEVSLESELEFLRDYSHIVCTRFHGRIAVTMNIDPDALCARVPSLVLQPLVENAVRHGLEPRAEGGTVEIVARRRVDLLELEVRDDGCGLPCEDASGIPSWREGVGLRNTRDRLQHLYGNAHRLSVRSRVTGGAIVAIQIPFAASSGRSGASQPAPLRHALQIVP
jgi:two-component system LytT family sensor kinase